MKFLTCLGFPMLYVEIGHIDTTSDHVSLRVRVEKPLIHGGVKLRILPAAHSRDIGFLRQAEGLICFIGIIINRTKRARRESRGQVVESRGDSLNELLDLSRLPFGSARGGITYLIVSSFGIHQDTIHVPSLAISLWLETFL